MKNIQVSNAAWQRLKIASFQASEQEGRSVPLHELIDRLIVPDVQGLEPVKPFTVVRVPNAVTTLMEGSDLTSGGVRTMGGSSEVERVAVNHVVAGSIPAPSAKSDLTPMVPHPSDEMYRSTNTDRKRGKDLKKRPARNTSAAPTGRTYKAGEAFAVTSPAPETAKPSGTVPTRNITIPVTMDTEPDLPRASGKTIHGPDAGFTIHEVKMEVCRRCGHSLSLHLHKGELGRCDKCTCHAWVAPTSGEKPDLF